MKHYLTLSGLLFLLFFVGCSKDHDLQPIEQNEPYVMEDLQWVLKEGDGEEVLERRLPDETITNNSGGLVQTTFEPLKKMEGSAHFQFNLPPDLSLDLESASQLVSVPAHLDLLSDSYAHIGGGIKVPFQQEKSTFPFSSKFEQSVEVQPQTQLSYQATVFVRKNTATFKATFVQPETKKRFELIGKWTGEFYQNIETHIVANELD